MSKESKNEPAEKIHLTRSDGEKDKIGQLPINRTNLTRTQEGVSRHNERFFVNAWTISVLPERFT